MSGILALDGALGPFSAAFLDDGEPRVAAGRGNDALETGLALVGEVLAGRALRDIERIAVSTGPGSFTGLRIALSYAKALAFAAGVPLVGVTSYDAVEPPDVQEPVATFVAGRPGRGAMRVRDGAAMSFHYGAYEALADTLAALLSGRAGVTLAGAPQGVAAHLGERDLTVRASAVAAHPPALAVALRARFATPAPSPHALVADYGEVPNYAVHAPT